MTLLGVAGLLLELLVATAYVVGVVCVRRAGRRWPTWQAAAFVGGVALAAFALRSGSGAGEDPSTHLAEHLLLMSVVAPLIAWGAPVRLAIAAGGPRLRAAAVGFLRGSATRTTDSRLGGLLVTVDYYGSMVVYVVTPWYEQSLRHDAVHLLTHAYFLACGVLFWLPVSGVNPTRWRPAHRIRLGLVGLGIPATALLTSVLLARASPLPGSTIDATRTAGWVVLATGVAATAAALIALALARPRRGEPERTMPPWPAVS